MSAFIVDTFLE